MAGIVKQYAIDVASTNLALAYIAMSFETPSINSQGSDTARYSAPQ